jgi:hypothetical protein
MAEKIAGTHGHEHAHGDEHGHHVDTFWSKYVFSTDHKMIAMQYMFTGMFMALIGGFFAYTFNMQMAFPGESVPRAAIGSERSDIVIEQTNGSRLRREEPGDEIEERGLTGPVRTQDHPALTDLHCQGHAVERAQAAERVGEAVDPERGHAVNPPAPVEAGRGGRPARTGSRPHR